MHKAISLCSLNFLNIHNSIDSLESGDMISFFSSHDSTDKFKKDPSRISSFDIIVVLHGQCVTLKYTSRTPESAAAMIGMWSSLSVSNNEFDSFPKIQSEVMR